MKDFYKILGVKEDATDEEIRARWVELTKQFHPDRGEGLSSDERIREINEAYQVLKHSSTRVEYDLRRTFGKKKGKSYSQKFAVAGGILVIAILIGIIYFTNFRDGTDGTDQTVPSPHPPIAASTHPPLASSTQGSATSTHQPIAASTQQRAAVSTQPAPPRHGTMDIKAQQRIDAPFQQPEVTAVTPTVPVLDQRNQTGKRNQMGPPTHPPIPASTNPRIPASTHTTISAARDTALAVQPSRERFDSADATDIQLQRSKESSDTTDSRISRPDVATGPSPIPAIGTEDEVRKFFKDYIERYNRMDVEGFFSLFSPVAVQNKKDGLEKIRKIYTNFFNQGQELHYRVQDMKIEIYQNAVEVKARYEINQVLKMGERMVWKGNVCWVLCKENGTFKILSLDYQHQPIH